VVTNLQAVKHSNRSAILSHIRQHGPISRRAIARELGMSPSTVSAAVGDLMGSELVKEVGQGVSTGGRRPILVGINPAGGLVVAVDVSSSARERVVRAAAFDLKNNAILELERPQEIYGNEAMLGAIQSIIAELLDSPEFDRRPPLAVGISVPGLVDAQAGELLYTSIGVRNLPLAHILRDSLQAPVIVQNSEDAAALGEFHFGLCHDCHSLLYISAGSGIGAGLVVGGEVYQPGRKSVGEIGHITVQADGPLCHCGNRGCLSALVTSEAIVQAVQEALDKGYQSQIGALTSTPIENLDIHQLMAAAKVGDPLCKEIFAEKAEWVGIAIAAVVNLLNPGVIVLGGELFEDGDYFLNLTSLVVQRRALPEYFDIDRLVCSTLGRNAALRGVGLLALEELFRVSNQSA
jgi:predicted NBD/HSP70 family sugar kinase